MKQPNDVMEIIKMLPLSDFIRLHSRPVQGAKNIYAKLVSSTTILSSLFNDNSFGSNLYAFLS